MLLNHLSSPKVLESIAMRLIFSLSVGAHKHETKLARWLVPVGRRDWHAASLCVSGAHLHRFCAQVRGQGLRVSPWGQTACGPTSRYLFYDLELLGGSVSHFTCEWNSNRSSLGVILGYEMHTGLLTMGQSGHFPCQGHFLETHSPCQSCSYLHLNQQWPSQNSRPTIAAG